MTRNPFGEGSSLIYAKIFAQIFESSLTEDYITRHVFMDLLILADEEGIVDMTFSAISRRTLVPEEVIRLAIQKLMAPDNNSRSAEREGRRLVPLDDHRDWGWMVVNYTKYAGIRNKEERREYHKNYYRQNRSASARSQQTQHASTNSTVENVESTVSTNSTNSTPHPQTHHHPQTHIKTKNEIPLIAEDDEKLLDAWSILRLRIQKFSGAPLPYSDEQWLREQLELRCLTVDELVKLADKNPLKKFASPVAGLKYLVKKAVGKTKSALEMEARTEHLNGFHRVKDAPRCDICSNVGRLAKGGYCECLMGKDLERFEKRKAEKQSAIAGLSTQPDNAHGTL